MTSTLLSSSSTSRPARALKTVAGFALLIVGGALAIPGVPGPGIPIVLLGLWTLKDEFAWARRALAWVSQRTERYRQTHQDGKGGRWKWLVACLRRGEGQGRQR